MTRRPTALRWAPPNLQAPTTVDLPSTYFAATYAADQDVTYTPNPAARVSAFTVTGGRSHVLRGGRLAPASGSALRFADVSGSVYVEGVSIDMAGNSSDAINVDGGPYAPDVYLQNIHATNINGGSSAMHADFFQPQGPIGRLFVDRVTFDSNYQGLFLANQSGIGEVHLSRVNARYNAIPGNPVTYLLWLREAGDPLNPPTTYLDRVYVEPRPGQTLADCVWPVAGTKNAAGKEIGMVLSADGTRGWFPRAANIIGEVRLGPPPGGDFCTLS